MKKKKLTKKELDDILSACAKWGVAVIKNASESPLWKYIKSHSSTKSPDTKCQETVLEILKEKDEK